MKGDPKPVLCTGRRLCTGRGPRKQYGDSALYCDECDYSTSRRGDLKKHGQSHSRSRPYPCEHCSKQFKNAGALTDHVRTHTGDRPFKCAHCPKMFTQHSNCWRHQVNIHGSRRTIDKRYRTHTLPKRERHAARRAAGQDVVAPAPTARRGRRPAATPTVPASPPATPTTTPTTTPTATPPATPPATPVAGADRGDPAYALAKALVESWSPEGYPPPWWLQVLSA